MSILEIMVLPFVAAIMLSFIQAYFGLHVLDRGIIFVDLALAQIAALGAVCAILIGIDIHGEHAFFVSLSFTAVGALLFTFTKPRDRRIPHEAIIGTIYVVATAATILVLDRAPKEAEHIKHMLVGNILFVDWTELIKTFLLYTGVALFHLAFRKKFLLITYRPHEAAEQGISVWWWDFLFYLTFGVVVTSAVRIAGVLLVFSYLIVTAIIGTYFATTLTQRIIVGSLIGILASLVGMVLSALTDSPTGAMIVVTFACFLVIAGIIKRMKPELKLSATNEGKLGKIKNNKGD